MPATAGSPRTVPRYDRCAIALHWLLAVMLTGMGEDGTEGARTVVKAGGRVLVQDEASSVAWDMPRGVVNAGLADSVLPLSSIGPEIAARLEAA